MNFYIVELLLIASVVLGGGIVSYLNATNKNQYIKLALAFSGGFLLAVIFQHLLPELYGAHHGHAHHAQETIPVFKVGVFILLGFLVQLVLEYFSGGIEHGHVHVHKGQAMPWALFISLSVHSIIEGIPLGNMLQIGIDPEHSVPFNGSFLWGIIFHQIGSNCPHDIVNGDKTQAQQCVAYSVGLWTHDANWRIARFGDHDPRVGNECATHFGGCGWDVFTHLNHNYL
jgi:zinc transporter ZupT